MDNPSDLAAGLFLKSVELRLLRCTLSSSSSPPSPPPPPSSPLRRLVLDLVGDIENGRYASVLSSPDVSALAFPFVHSYPFEDSVDSAARFYDQLGLSAAAFLEAGRRPDAWLEVLDDDVEDVDVEGRLALLLCLAVAAVLAFTQQNFTGPIGSFSPFPLMCLGAEEFGNGGSGGNWDLWARNEITLVGSELQGKFSLLQYIVCANIVLKKILDFATEGDRSCIDGCKSTFWWLCRVLLLQQRILDDLSSSLYDLLQSFKEKTLFQFGEAGNVAIYWGSMLSEGEAPAIATLAQVESGIIDYKYGRVDSSRTHLKYAEEACVLQFTVTGALGFRTEHQVEPKAQLVLATNTYQPHADGSASSFYEGKSDVMISEDASDDTDLASCSDILMAPKLVEKENNGSLLGGFTHVTKDIMLTPAQQAVILAHCMLLGRQSRVDELSRWEMAPYIEAIDLQRRANYVIRRVSDILRIRWESSRSHTKQRALLMMDKLVEVVNNTSPEASQRVQLSFAAYIPSIPALRKEYGELLVSCGMIGEALKIFEDIELWDNVILCYQLLGKKAAAVELINVRLQDTPNDPRLWCSLGDSTNNDSCYEKALEVSSNRSARAKRSLARSAYNRGDYTLSKDLWESALALNSLYPDGWFALGAAALKARDIDKALDAFTRAVQLDPDNGEAWNNVACLHMIKKSSKAAFIAFKEAIKFRRNSWQLWENFSHVALDIGNIQQALEAVKMVLELSKNKRTDIELLDNILKMFEQNSKIIPLEGTGEILDDSGNALSPHSLDDSFAESPHSEFILKDLRNVEPLLDMLGQIIQQIIKHGGQGEIWGLYARWLKIKGDLTMCSEALLKQVRSYQGSELWHDRDRFRKFAHASLQLCKVYMEIASSTGSRKELFAAEMHLRSAVKQATNFSDTEEFRDLTSCLDAVKKQLDAISNGSALVLNNDEVHNDKTMKIN